ncbi:tumor necrosis factor alpha-induced protein 2 [Megalops cyprinoides]|uniref:tumor necrosis factor alpha-induced protein 2 n=1 Tax=Megalops cyprinoides TaxID=118141 RepID=UPI00186501AE|nr:tumor necrosis factor alpha-induced protein 2 [Megalops cyprinoides]
MPMLEHGPSLQASRGSGRDLILPKTSLNPFDEGDGNEGWSPLEGEKNEANEARHGVTGKNRPLKGTVERIRGVSPLKTLGKLGKGLRLAGLNKERDPLSQRCSKTLPSTLPSNKEKRKSSRRSSEEIMSLLRLAGRRMEALLTEGLSNGDLSPDGDSESRRRLSFLKMVNRTKLKRESLVESVPQEPEEEQVEEEPEVKHREPLSVLEILQLVTKRDLLLADTHILELERECEEAAMLLAVQGEAPGALAEESAVPGSKDSARRKAKDLELLYEALQKELWDVVRESLRFPTSGPSLGLVVLVVQQEEQVDRDWAGKEGASPGARPRQLKRRWKQAVAEAADGSLPQQVEVQVGQMEQYLERLGTRVVEDLGAARRNVLCIYPEEFAAPSVYAQSYHQAVAQRLRSVTSSPLHISDIYSLLDWIYNVYDRDVLSMVDTTMSVSRSQLGPLLPPDTIEMLELDCLSSVSEKVTRELAEVLDEEERRWARSLHIEEYQSSLPRTVIKRLQVDLERSVAIKRELGARVAQCSLSGLADFLYSFQRKVAVFHETQIEFGELCDGYIAKTIAFVNCCPPFRTFIQRCSQYGPAGSEDFTRRANASLDRIVSQGVKILIDRLFEHIGPLFNKLVKRKWLNNTDAYDAIEATIKQHFRKFRRMDCPPYQALVGQVHRRVLIEYLRAIMKGRVICTSLKMRKRMAYRLRSEGKRLKVLFEDLDSGSSWMDGAITHLSEMILLDDISSIQTAVKVLVREFPDIRRKHISAVLNIRGMMRQAERQEVLNTVRDLEGSDGLSRASRESALFSEVPVTSEMHCLNMGLARIALAASSCLSSVRPHRRSSSWREAPVKATKQ